MQDLYHQQYDEIYEEVQVFKRSWDSLKQEGGPWPVKGFGFRF